MKNKFLREKRVHDLLLPLTQKWKKKKKVSILINKFKKLIWSFSSSSFLGSDFIKTSTGKETVNATFPVAIVMLRAIRDFFWKTGNKVFYCQQIFLPWSKDDVIYHTSHSHDSCLYMQML